MAIVVIYLLISVLQFGLKDGFIVTIVSWSFFVFCTPIADAGFLLDFPVRLVTGVRMLNTEIIVWAIAATVNVITLLSNPAIYQKTALLQLFYQIITKPWPLWLIILLSAVGTFVSIYLGDDAFDIVVSNNKLSMYKRDKIRIYFSAVIFILTGILYFALLYLTHINIKVI